MDPTAITAALIAGAAAASSDVASAAVKDAYAALKKILTDGYNVVATAILDRKPDSPASHAAVIEEIQDNPAIAGDPAVQEKVRAVQEALLAMPAEQRAALGIDIDYVIAGRDIHAVSRAVTGKKWEAKRDVKLSASFGENSSGKN